jgi:hypothetical protein
MANQYHSPKGDIMRQLRTARTALEYCNHARAGRSTITPAYALMVARLCLAAARAMMAAAPASTRRRWKAGR